MAKAKKVNQIEIEANDTVEDHILKTFKKEYGEGILTTMDQEHLSSVKEWIHSGSYLIDNIVSCGKGYPVGKMVALAGAKSSGKSTLAAMLIREAQKAGAIAVWLDTEYAFDKSRAIQLGVNTDKLLFGQPEYMEQAFAQIENIINISKEHDRLTVIVWDSIASTPTKSEFEAEDLTSGGNYGEHSKIISKGLRRLMGLIARTRTLLFVVNQTKMDLNSPWGGTTYLGKKPLEFHSHVMMEIHQEAQVKTSDTPIGISSKIKVTKNRVSAPFREESVRIMFEDGFDIGYDAVMFGELHRRAIKNGNMYLITKDCVCENGKIDGKKCPECEGIGLVQVDGTKKFFLLNASEALRENPSAYNYLVTGVLGE